MVPRVRRFLYRVLRSLATDPGRFATGSAMSDPLALLAMELERIIERRQSRSDGGAPPPPPHSQMEEP
jgi:hypothetical protein